MEELALASHSDLTELHGAKGVVFRSTAPGSLSDRHHAPRWQYIITLSGEAEIGLGDGTLHRLGPGDVNMAEDLTGHGHTTRVVGQVPRSPPRSTWRGEGDRRGYTGVNDDLV